MDTHVTLKPAITDQGWNYLIIQTCHNHLKVIISNDLPPTDLFLPDDQTRSHLRSISRHIHYNPTRFHSSLPAPPVLLMVFHSSPGAHSQLMVNIGNTMLAYVFIYLFFVQVWCKKFKGGNASVSPSVFVRVFNFYSTFNQGLTVTIWIHPCKISCK